MSEKQCRWGFLSTAGIGAKNWHAIKCCENAILVGVASRNMESAEQFISVCQEQIPHATRPEPIEGYENLLARDDIDAVYVPLPTGVRKEWVIRSAEAGKHVLCEKPCAINANDLKEMLAACQANGVQFMDGVMLIHTDRMKQLQSHLDGIGELRRIYSQLSFLGDADFRNFNIRGDGALEPQGCLGDLGWYNIRLALIATNWELPVAVRATTLAEYQREGSAAVPTSMSAELIFANGLSAGFYCSFDIEHQQWAVFGGSKGTVKINDFVLPFSDEELATEIHHAGMEVDRCLFKMYENKSVVRTQESGNNAVDSQEAKLFRRFSAIVNSGTIDTSWGEISLKTQYVVDACLDSANCDGKPVVIPKM